MFTVANNLDGPQDGIIERLGLVSGSDDFAKVKIKREAKDHIIKKLESQFDLSKEYLKSPIEELAKRIKALYP